MSSIVIETVSDGIMKFTTSDGSFELPYEVVCQAADQIRHMVLPTEQLRKKQCIYIVPEGFTSIHPCDELYALLVPKPPPPVDIYGD